MVKSEIPVEQLKQAIKRLSLKERNKLLKEFREKTPEEQFGQMLKRVNNRRKKAKISMKEITKEIEKARQEYYDRYHRH